MKILYLIFNQFLDHKENNGIQGETGNGISSIVKTSTAGLIDTYTITYTNGNTTTFDVTNGQDGEVTEEQLQDVYEQMSSEMETATETGTSIDTDDSAYWRAGLELGGNTSQEVIAEVTGTEVDGTTITINDYDTTKEHKFTKFSGDTFQQTYTGKNLLNTTVTQTVINNNGAERPGFYYKATTSGTYYFDFSQIDVNFTYYIGKTSDLTQNATSLGLVQYTSVEKTLTFSFNQDEYIVLWAPSISDAQRAIMICLDSLTDKSYEPYVRRNAKSKS